MTSRHFIAQAIACSKRRAEEKKSVCGTVTSCPTRGLAWSNYAALGKTALRNLLTGETGLRERWPLVTTCPPLRRLKCIQFWSLNIYTVLGVTADVTFLGISVNDHPCF